MSVARDWADGGERRVLEESPEVQWFDTNPSCRMCRKKSDGVLYGRQNQSYGHHCKRCAEKRIAAAKRVRAELAKVSP